MIGRTAPSNPWIFRQIAQYAETGRYDQPTEADRYQMIRTYFEMLIEEECPAAGQDEAVRLMVHARRPGGAAGSCLL